jgi:hypothetical protein
MRRPKVLADLVGNDERAGPLSSRRSGIRVAARLRRRPANHALTRWHGASGFRLGPNVDVFFSERTV